MDTSTVRHEALVRAIAILGSQSALARALGKKQPYVPKWLKSPGGLPLEYCPDVERLTNRRVRCEELNDNADWLFVRRGGLLDALGEIVDALVADGFDRDRVRSTLERFAERETVALGTVKRGPMDPQNE